MSGFRTHMTFNRRTFIATAAAFGGYAAAGRARAADTYRNEVAGYGPLRSDPSRILDLPEGFSYRVISQAGETMSDGLLVPGKFDGMGCFPLDDERVALVRNHELNPRDVHMGPFGVDNRLVGGFDRAKAYDWYPDGSAPLGGGTTTVVYNLRTGRTERQHLSLVGTTINCAGGHTPWNSWLSCEEATLSQKDGLPREHGYVFEVPAAATGLVDPLPLKAMGRFRHEAACIDPRTGIVYLTEDQDDGLFYRFLPNDRVNLASGGRLQALGLRDVPEGADTRNWDDPYWAVGDRRQAFWIDMDGVESPDADLNWRGHRKGGAYFARGEGIFWAGDHLYFTCTSGGAAKLTQIMRYVPSPREGQPGERREPGVLELFLESADDRVMNYADNLVVAPWGHVIVCEDKREGVQHLKGVTPQGRVYALARNAMPVEDGGSNTEFAGACFTPDGRTMFVNLYHPGLTLAITGPWERLQG
jgi:secreted PhoX family phosphatase